VAFMYGRRNHGKVCACLNFCFNCALVRERGVLVDIFYFGVPLHRITG
jgi:hypothetical protein